LLGHFSGLGERGGGNGRGEDKKFPNRAIRGRAACLCVLKA